jgi:nucleoside-diphosphate-sugar epimerase
MKFLITGEKGFIGRNLVLTAKKHGHKVLELCDQSNKIGDLECRVPSKTGHTVSMWEREPCVHRNPHEVWAKVIQENNVDVVIHNAAVVGTDVVALNPGEATLTNVAGTYNIVKACELAGVPISYMGTTVVYDTPQYQETYINEQSVVKPTTFYGQLKHTGDLIVNESKARSNIIRPLFAYGGEGDMNSLIAKICFGAFTGRDDLDMFLDPKKYKDYLHVNDFCDAVIMASELGLWGEDFIVAAEDPRVTGEIVEAVDKVLHEDYNDSHQNNGTQMIEWYPETDYLGNHRLSSKSFRAATGWAPSISLEEGIKMVAKSIKEASRSLEYNPFIHLDDAKQRGIDLTKFY